MVSSMNDGSSNSDGPNGSYDSLSDNVVELNNRNDDLSNAGTGILGNATAMDTPNLYEVTGLVSNLTNSSFPSKFTLDNTSTKHALKYDGNGISIRFGELTYPLSTMNPSSKVTNTASGSISIAGANKNTHLGVEYDKKNGLSEPRIDDHHVEGLLPTSGSYGIFGVTLTSLKDIDVLTRRIEAGRSSFARCLIEVNADDVLKESLTIGVPLIDDSSFSIKTVRIEYEWRLPRCDTCKIFDHVHDQCPNNTMVTPTPIVEKSNDGFLKVANKWKTRKSGSNNGTKFGGRSVKLNFSGSLNVNQGGSHGPSSSSNIPTLNPYDALNDMESDEKVEVAIEKLKILEVMPFVVGQLPMKYLGVPLITKNIGISKCNQLVKRVKQKVNDWKNRALSYADIEKVLKGFLWSQGDLKKGAAKVFLKVICDPKSQGGLGLKRLGPWNEALLCKHFWNVITKKEIIWVKWVNVVKLKRRSIWEVSIEDSNSGTWKAMLNLRRKIKNYVWHDIGDARFDEQASVSDLIVNGDWIRPKEWRQFNILNNMKVRVLTDRKADSVMWIGFNRKKEKLSMRSVWEIFKE
ncbi:hypothetical protein Tco_0170045 [Tanacetum coccineum]